MPKEQSQFSLEELAVIAKTGALKAKDNSLSIQERQQANVEKQIALTALINELMNKIYVEFPKPDNIVLSREIYEESLQETLLYICKNIDNYNSEKGSVMGWFIYIFKKRKLNVFKWLNWNNKIIWEYPDTDIVNSGIIDNYYPLNINPLPSEELIDIIKEDPEGLFINTIFKNNPDANFQVIALKRISGMSWQEIVQELNLGNTVGPISTFYQRCCKQFAPKIREYFGN